MCSKCDAPTQAQKQRRADANCEKQKAIKQARDNNVVKLCGEALQCGDSNKYGEVEVFKNAGHGYTVKWCDEVVFVTHFLVQIKKAKKISCWIADLRSMARRTNRQRQSAYLTRISYGAETQRIEEAFSTC